MAPNARQRAPGRPRRAIDLEDVASAAARLFAQSGYESVSIARVAQELDVSRATLYRTVPSKEHLLGILFQGVTTDLLAASRAVVRSGPPSPRERLVALIRLQIGAAISTRHYLFVFFDTSDLPPDVHAHWHGFRRDYEELWEQAIADAMAAGALPQDNPRITMRLVLGMCIWVSRWYRPEHGLSDTDIAESVARLLLSAPAGAGAGPDGPASTSSSVLPPA